MARTANTGSESPAPPAPSVRRSSRCSPSGSSRSAELRPLASARSAGSKVHFAGERARGPGADRRLDPGARPGPLLGRRQGERRVGAEMDRGRERWSSTTRASGGCTRTSRWWSRRSTTTPPRPQRPGRQPELHDDGADGRAEADPRRGRDRAADRLHLPVGLRHRPRGDQGAARASAGGARGQAGGDAAGLSAPGRLQRAPAGGELQGRRRLHDRGAQGDGRDPQDPRPLRGRRDLGDLCPRPGGHRSLRVRERPDRARALSPDECRELLSGRARAWSSSTIRATASTRCRSRPPAATRSWSGGSAATPRTSAASTSGSSATTCARARPQRGVQVAELLHQRDLVRVPAGAFLSCNLWPGSSFLSFRSPSSLIKALTGPRPRPRGPAPHYNHVFIVVLRENEDASTTSAQGTVPSNLARNLTSRVAFVPNYYATGHFSLDNYISER